MKTVSDTKNCIYNIKIIYLYANYTLQKRKTVINYFAKKGNKTIELTTDSALNTYIRALEEHLGLSKAYCTVGFLSSSVKRFLNMSIAERTKYIGKWLPNIKNVIDDYNICRQKLGYLQRDRKYIEKELANIAQIQTSEIDNIDESIKELQLDIEKFRTLYDKGNVFISMFAQSAKEFPYKKQEYYNYCIETRELGNKLQKSLEYVKQESVQNIEEKYEKLQKDLHTTDIEIIDLQNTQHILQNSIRDNENTQNYIRLQKTNDTEQSLQSLKSELSFLKKQVPKELYGKIKGWRTF